MQENDIYCLKSCRNCSKLEVVESRFKILHPADCTKIARCRLRQLGNILRNLPNRK